MPNAEGHDRITFIVTAATGIAGTFAYGWRCGLVASVACFLSGWMGSPDLDLNSAPSNRWGPFEFIWWPYRAIADHRGFSHWPVIGVATRMLYLYAAIILLVAAAIWFYKWPWLRGIERTMRNAETAGPDLPASLATAFIWTWDSINAARNESAGLVWAGLIGAEIGAESHIIADVVYSWWKRKYGKKTKPTTRPARREMRKAA